MARRRSKGPAATARRARARGPAKAPPAAADTQTLDADAEAPEGEAEPVEEPALDTANTRPETTPSIDEAEEEEEHDGRAVVPFDPLQRYLTEIRRYPLLTREEEKELAIRYNERQDIDAAYKLVTGNLRLVVM